MPLITQKIQALLKDLYTTKAKLGKRDKKQAK